MPFDIFLLVIVSILVVGAILFFLTGFIIVKKNHIAIIEKAGQFEGIYESGWHYFRPLLYRRAGMYKKGEAQIKLEINRINYLLTYEIIDVKKFHYEGNHDFLGIVKASLKEDKTKISDYLINRFNLVGVRFIKLEKLKK